VTLFNKNILVRILTTTVEHWFLTSAESSDTSWTSEGLIKVPSSSTTSRPAFSSLNSSPGGTPSATHLFWFAKEEWDKIYYLCLQPRGYEYSQNNIIAINFFPKIPIIIAKLSLITISSYELTFFINNSVALCHACNLWNLNDQKCLQKIAFNCP